MALNFPDSPTDGQKYTDATTGETWTYESSTNSWTSDGLTTAAGIIYKGGIDITAAPPAGAANGWQYTVTTGGTANAGFTGLTGNIAAGAIILYDGANWQQAGASASETTAGIVELATAAETTAGTDASRAVHPAGLKVELDKKAVDAPDGTAAGTKQYVRQVATTGTGTLAQAKTWEEPSFTQAGTGAVTRSIESKLKDVVSVKDFGAVGDGVKDDTAAIQAACSAAKTVTFGPATNSYKVSATITLTSDTTLELQGARITQVSDQTPIFNATSTDNVTIAGGRFIGKSEAVYLNSASSQAICIKADNATDLAVIANRFENFYYSALSVQAGGNRIEFSSNNVKGPGSAVLGSDVNYRNTNGAVVTGANLRIVNNDIYDTAQGIIVGQGSRGIVVDGNTIHDLINEHGIYADTGLRQLTISNNVIYNTGAHGVGLKVQCYDAFGIQPQDIAITGNTISNTGTDGILIDNTTVSPTLATLDVTITGNSILNAGAYAIDVRDAQGCTVTGNTLVAPGQSGVAWANCIGLLVADNYVRGSGTSGMRDLALSSNVTIKNNIIADCATSNVAADEYGIFLNSGANPCVIEGNVISDASANMQYGIYHFPALNSTLSIIRNTVTQSTDSALRLGSTAALREYRGNVWEATSSATYNDPGLPVVASAATITLPSGADVVSISGTTNITGITHNGHSGRIVTLVFQDSLTVARGAGFLVSASLGDFNATSNDTLTLCCDGITWYEISRSIN